MARKYVLVDDLSGAESTDAAPVETIPFGYLGKSYTIDLNPANAGKLAKALAPFVEKATETVPEPTVTKLRGARSRSHVPAGADADNKHAREWARTQPKQFPNVPVRGRLPGEIREAWERAGKPVVSEGQGAAQAPREPAAQAS